jgi:PepSY-associated TM region
MKALVILHRWLGVGFCLLFAMWFATGIVMHFVPFPALTEAERIVGLMPVDPGLVRHGPDQAVEASGIKDASRVRLVQRSDGPVYIVSGGSKPSAMRADNLGDASLKSAATALDVARAHARRRGIDSSHAAVAELADYDQWTVPNGYDAHRPLYRIALNDSAGTELYISSTTGEVVLDTTRYQRVWNYVGSVAHWIYPTVLRSNWAAWDKVVWTLSLVALVAAISGVVLGFIRIRVSGAGIRSPYRGWHAWHHVLGLITATFVVTWIFSGWLSMDHGLLFSRGQLSATEAAGIASRFGWNRLSGEASRISAPSKEIEWFVLGDQFYRRERTDIGTQMLFRLASQPEVPHPFLSADQVGAYVGRAAPNCAAPTMIGVDDNYAADSSMPTAPVYRSVCGDVWFHIDGASGAILERLDSSRRAYRWFYTALHTFNFPMLSAHPAVRSAMIVFLCSLGLVFSITGAVIGWRRLRHSFEPTLPAVENR